jgi:hypothetical protein
MEVLKNQKVKSLTQNILGLFVVTVSDLSLGQEVFERILGLLLVQTLLDELIDLLSSFLLMRREPELLLETPKESRLNLVFIFNVLPKTDQIDHLVFGPVSHKDKNPSMLGLFGFLHDLPYLTWNFLFH